VVVLVTQAILVILVVQEIQVVLETLVMLETQVALLQITGHQKVVIVELLSVET
jgi:hypothetical protein